MKRYNNLSGESGVVAYETGRDFIKIKFVDGRTYIYDFKVPGRMHVQAMKKLAAAGKGLSSYISRYVREKYAGREGN